MDDPSKPSGPPTNLPTIPGQTKPNLPSLPPSGQASSSPTLPKPPLPPVQTGNRPLPPVLAPGAGADPSKSTQPSAPAVRTGPPPQNAGDLIQSSIRTMRQDVESLSKGGKVSGAPVEHLAQGALPSKPVEAKSAIPPAGPPAKIEIPRQTVQLGAPEKAKPLPAPSLPASAPGMSKPLITAPPSSIKPPVPPISPSSPTAGISVPPGGKSSFSNSLFYIIIVLALAAGFLIWFLYIRSDEVAVVPTPTIQATPFPTPTPYPANAFVLRSVGDAASQVGAFVANTSVNSQELKVFNIIAEDRSPVLFGSLFQRMAISLPPQVSVALASSSMRLMVYGQTETFGNAGNKAFGFAVDNNAGNLITLMRSWEAGMPLDLSPLLGIDPAKANKNTFLNNTYKGVAIRYMNFPSPDKTIDYAVITKGGQSYLVIANSRQSMFAAIDAASLEAFNLPEATSGAFPGSQVIETPSMGK